MSHLKERNEKECLNCNAIIYGRFCHVCGQENVEPKETFLHLVKHFIEDVTHFDGKFFDTLKYLLTRPGFLSYEYMRGRRHSYLNPIRMYVFTSAIYFLVASSVNYSKEPTMHQKPLVAENEKPTIEHAKDSTHLRNTAMQHDTAKHISTYSEKDEIEFEFKNNIDSLALEIKEIEKSITEAKTPVEKEKLQTKIETRNFIIKVFKFSLDIYQATPYFPKVMFITLPIMALLLQLFNRKLKQFYYANHIIFILHLYVAIFLIELVCIGLDYFDEKTHWPIFSFLSIGAIFVEFFYMYKAMRNFYHQSRFKTFMRCIWLLFFFISLVLYCLYLFKNITLLNAH